MLEASPDTMLDMIKDFVGCPSLSSKDSVLLGGPSGTTQLLVVRKLREISFRKENRDPSRECCEAVSPFLSSSRLEIAIESRSAVTTGVVAGEEDGRRINSFTEPSP